MTSEEMISILQDLNRAHGIVNAVGQIAYAAPLTTARQDIDRSINKIKWDLEKRIRKVRVK